jgi:hypothetical protein
MTATEALERRIDELCRENEQLRQQVASIIGRSFRTADKMDCLDTENAKLRQLALDFYDAIDSVFWDGETETKERFKPRLRELGIEVTPCAR